MPANDQETLIAKLSAATMGRRSVFEPSEYRKGTASREPADVAWHCRDAVALMYLKSGKGGWRADTAKNLRQARGWLKAWRNGRPLSGNVEEGAVFVPYQPALAVAVLSVSADPTLSTIVRHDDDARVLGIDACATVSQTFLEALADDYLGIADVALLLREWPKAQAHSLSDIDFFHQYCGTALTKAAERAEWDWHTRPIDDPHLKHVIGIIRNMRSVTETVKPGAVALNFHPNELYSDFTLVEQWQLFYTFGRAIHLVHEGMPFIHLDTTIGGYKIGVQVAEQPRGWESLGSMAQPGLDLVLSYALGIDIMLYATKPDLDLRKPTVAWRALRDIRPVDQPQTG